MMWRAFLVFLLALLVAGIWWFVELEPSPARAPLTLQPAEDGLAARALREFEAGDTNARKETGVPTAQNAPTLPPKEQQQLTATLRARCIDENGKPIAGVELRGGGNRAPVATSGADGRIEGQLGVWGAEGSQVWIVLRETFRLQHSEDRVLRPDAVCDLGDVVLPGAGHILGRVVDERGAPLAKAAVWSTRGEFAEWKSAQEHDSAWAATAEDGSFVLECVPCGAMRVIARAKGYAPAQRSPLEVRAGEELRGVEIVLGEHVAEDEGAGLVVRVHDPSGAPFPGAILVWAAPEPGGGSSGSGHFDAAGTHKILCGPEARVSVRAADPAGRYAAACAFELPGSQSSVDLVLGETSMHTLLATDEQEKPVESYAFRTLQQSEWTPFENRTSTDEHGLLHCTLPDPSSTGDIGDGSQPATAHPAGRAELRVPPMSFVVQVDAKDFALAQFGPFRPADVPPELRVTLQRQPGIRGIVTVDGKPTGGATVELVEAVGKRELLVYGMPSRVMASPIGTTTSADDGSFALQLRDAGVYEVQARLAGRGLAESGPLHLLPSTGARDLVLEIPASGAIEGHVLASPGTKLRDLVVGASRGDGHPISVRTDAEGGFRFERLPPGKWLLRLLGEEIDPHGETTELRDAPPARSELPSSCEVRPNETTKADIDLRQSAELVARIELAGWAEARWYALLEPEGATQCRGASVEDVDLEHLRVRVDQPGDYRLNIHGKVAGTPDSIGFEERVHLEAGENAWKFSAAVGELVLANRGEAALYTYLRSTVAGGREIGINLQMPAHSEQKLAGIPLGSWSRIAWKDGQPVEDGATEVTSTTAGHFEWD